MSEPTYCPHQYACRECQEQLDKVVRSWSAEVGRLVKKLEEKERELETLRPYKHRVGRQRDAQRGSCAATPIIFDLLLYKRWVKHGQSFISVPASIRLVLRSRSGRDE